MSLRHMSRFLIQASVRGMQGLKDQASKYDSAIKTVKDSGSSKQAWRFSGAFDSFKSKNSDEKRKLAEESLRTVMYLSCWGPN